MNNTQRSLRGALLAGTALLVVGCSDSGTDPRPRTFRGCPVEEVFVNERLSGTLASGDCRIDGFFVDMYYLEVSRDRMMIVDLESFDFDAYLELYDFDTGQLVADNDDLNDFTTDARLAGDVPRGRYVVAATSFNPGETGRYQLTVD